MKLKDRFVKQMIDDTQYLVAVGDEPFNGMIRSNGTAGHIVDLLETETTEEEIIEKMVQTYAAPRDRIAADVHRILDTLRSVGALEE